MRLRIAFPCAQPSTRLRYGDTGHARADTDVTVTRCCQDTRLKPDGGVVVAGGVIIAVERVLTNSCIYKAAG